MDDQPIGKRVPASLENQLAAIDRLDVFTDSLARRVAAYYANLIERGLPHEVATLLVRDWHAMQLNALSEIYQKFAG